MERKQKSKCVQEELQTSVEKRAMKWRGKRCAIDTQRDKIIRRTVHPEATSVFDKYLKRFRSKNGNGSCERKGKIRD